MALTDTVQTSAPTADEPRTSRLGAWWVIIGFALILLTAIGWQFLKDPTITAPTRDPAWYSWRANLILYASPGSIARPWGPASTFSGGYRVTAPLAGALLQRIAGIDQYSFSAFLMVGIPVLSGLALGAAGFRSRRDPLIVLLSMLAAAALFLTIPYVGYLDDTTMLLLLCIMLAFLPAARTSWSARSAVFLIALTAGFTHPTTCVLFGMVLLAVFVQHLVTSRFSLGSALRSDGPMLMACGFGMIGGLSMWLVGVWGPTAKLSDAALPPPYTKAFFESRLAQWVGSLQPLVIGPLIAVAVLSVIWWTRRERKPAGEHEVLSIWWLLPLAGTLTFLAGAVVPYYRFMNATAAVMPLTALGAFVAIRWFLRLDGAKRMAGVLASVAIVGALGWVFFDGLEHRWAGEKTQWVNQDGRVALAAVHEVVADAGVRPNVFVANFADTATAYGWAKTFTNILRNGLPGQDAQYSATYFGTVENLLAGRPTVGKDEGYTTTSRNYFADMRAQERRYPAAPLVILVGQFYKGQVDTAAALSSGVPIGPDVSVLTGPGFYTPTGASVQRAQAAAAAEKAHLDDHGGPFSDPLHTLRVLIGLFFLAVLPGLIAADWFDLKDTPSRIGLIPGISIVMTLLSGIAVLAIWRGPLTTVKAWAVVAIASLVALGLRFGKARVLAVLESFGGFFNKLFVVFSNRAFGTLMGVQFAVQAGQGVVQGAIAKSIAFGGEKGFDVTVVPSAQYLLKVVLALYVPYTLVSPFIGVVIDRFERRRILTWANLVTAAVVSLVAVGVMLPLGKGTSEGKVGATVALIVGLLFIQGCVRVALAVKSAAIPDVLSGKDLLQGNGLSQAGGALFQVLGIGFAFGAAAVAPSWIVVILGAGVLILAAVVAKRLERMEARAHDSTFGQEVKRVVSDIRAGLKEVASRPPAALGLFSFQMLRYQFWGFCLFTFGLYAKHLVQGGSANNLGLALVGGGGFLGGALGLVLAQKWKDRVPPIRMLLASMAALGIASIVFGPVVSLAGFAALLFVGFFTFFLGKISADTIMQQSMPDDFRGRAFALFDIAYNLGFIVPAFILSFLWVEGSASRTRVILIGSGAVFVLLTVLIWRWSIRIREQFARQDDAASLG
ncbi:MAG: MFS transporter [Acidimicrobiia bacterium]